jgi:hypothetical protein
MPDTPAAHSDWQWRRAQFITLSRVFLGRIVDFELLAKDADTTKLVGQFMAVLTGISFMLSVPVILIGGGLGVGATAWTPQHFLIATTLLFVGGVSVMSWDAALPDRRDVLVLGPLPVPMSTLFAAKITALFAAPALTIVSLNLFTGIVWPLLFSSQGHGFLHALRAWPAYWMVMICGGTFLFCALLTLQGLLQNILPRQLFLRLSAVTQAAILCALVCLYLLEPSLESTQALTAPENQRVLAWLPAYWFLGMFQQLNGSMQPEFVWLARRAYWMLGASMLGAIVTVMLSYLRILPKIVEQPEIVPAVRSFPLPAWMGGAFNQAIALFSMRTLMRSRQHRMILSFYVGIGLAIVIAYGRTTAGDRGLAATGIPITSLLASVLLIVLPVLALRMVAAMPISLKANWVMQMTQVRRERCYRRATRFSWLVMTVLPLELALGGVFLCVYPRGPVWLHLGLLLALGMLSVEVCLITFAKVPFACSYLPGKANMHFIFWVALFVVIGILQQAIAFESRMLQKPWRFLISPLLLLLLAAAVAFMTEMRSRKKDLLIFEEEYEEQLVTLNLG